MNTTIDKCIAVQTILESCPLLKSLKVTGLQPSDLLSGKSWVCSDLSTLSIELTCRDQDMDTIRNEFRMVFEILSKLEKLEHLDLHECPGEADTDDERLDLRLRCEVAQLPALKDLRYFYFGFSVLITSVEDATWMIRHWARLEHVIGHYNEDSSFELKSNSRSLQTT